MSRYSRFQQVANLRNTSDFIVSQSRNAPSQLTKVAEQEPIKTARPSDVMPVQPFKVIESIGSFVSPKLTSPWSVSFFPQLTSMNWIFSNLGTSLIEASSIAFTQPESWISLSVLLFLKHSQRAELCKPVQSAKSIVTRWWQASKMSLKFMLVRRFIRLRDSSWRLGATIPILLKRSGLSQ